MLRCELHQTGTVLSSHVVSALASTATYHRLRAASRFSNFYSSLRKTVCLWKNSWNISRGLYVFFKQTSSLNDLYFSFEKGTYMLGIFYCVNACRVLRNVVSRLSPFTVNGNSHCFHASKIYAIDRGTRNKSEVVAGKKHFSQTLSVERLRVITTA